jgi:hypothetical protein
MRGRSSRAAWSSTHTSSTRTTIGKKMPPAPSASDQYRAASAACAGSSPSTRRTRTLVSKACTADRPLDDCLLHLFQSQPRAILGPRRPRREKFFERDLVWRLSFPRFSSRRTDGAGCCRFPRLLQIEGDHLYSMPQQRLEGGDGVNQRLVDFCLNLKCSLHRSSGFGGRGSGLGFGPHSSVVR